MCIILESEQHVRKKLKCIYRKKGEKKEKERQIEGGRGGGGAQVD